MSLAFLFELLLDAFLIGFPVLYFYRKKLNPLKELKLEFKGFSFTAKKSFSLLLLILIVALALGIVFSFAGLNDLVKVETVLKQIMQISPFLIAYFFTVRIIAEEVFFRGFLAEKTGIWVSSGIFALSHLAYGSVLEVIGAFALGALLAWQFKANKNLLPNILAHGAYNFIILGLLLA